MSDEPSALEAFQVEMKEQLETMKSAFEQEIAELKETNNKLLEDNKELNRALVRSTLQPAPEPAETKTPEEIAEAEYTQKLKAIYEKSLNYSKEI